MAAKRGRKPLPKKHRKVSTTVYLSPGLQRSLQQLAARLDISMGQILREGARLMLEKHVKTKR